MDTVAIGKLQYLLIGQQGENAANNIPIDMTEWVAEFPNANFHLLFKAYNATSPLPMVTTYDAETHILTWTPTLDATQVAGVGYTEVRALDTGVLKKSRIIPTTVENSVTGVEGGTVPEPYEDWVNLCLSYKDDAEAAKTAAEASQEAAETAQGKAEDAQDAAEDAQEAAESAKDDAVSAKETAVDAAALMVNATATATQLPTGSDPTATVTPETDHMAFSFGIPAPETPILPDATTGQKGIVMLEDSTSSTSTSKAATPNSVKSVYDFASGKLSSDQGSANAGKWMKVGTDGEIVPDDLPSKANPSTALSLTLVAGSWTSATPPTQTLTAIGVTASNNITVGIGSAATDAQIKEAAAGRILCTAQAADSLTFTCYGDEPSGNIPVAVLIVG